MHIIPTIHPAAILRGGKPIADPVMEDLMKAQRISIEGYNHPENLVVCLPDSPGGIEFTVRTALAWMDRWLQLKCPVAVDVETSSLDFFNCKLYSIALSGEDGYNTAVAFTLADYHTLPWDAELALTQKLDLILADPAISTVYHNAPYDYAVLYNKGYTINGPIEDTQAYHHLVQPDLPHTLDWVGHTYLDCEPWKLNHDGSKMAFTQDVTELLYYNAKDALNTMKLRGRLYQEVRDRGMSNELISYQMAFARLASRMEIVGIPINQELRKKMGEEELQRLEGLKVYLRDWLDWPDFNPMSKDHVVSALYSKKYVGLTPEYFTEKTGQPSTKAEHIIDHMGHPFVKKLVTYIERHHAWSTQYKDPKPGEPAKKGGAYYRAIREDGRLHPTWNPTGQKGSRWSSKPNAQNQPKADRAFFEAPPSRVIIGSDKDSLELRIVACFSGVRELIEEMNKPDGDPHTLAAINIYGDAFLGKPPKERKLLRNAVKNVVYASLYRAGVNTVYRTIRGKKFLPPSLRAALTREEVSRIYHGYFGKYKEIPEWHDANLEFAEKNHYISIPPFGRRRYFPTEIPFTEIANWCGQTPGSDYVGKEMVEIQDELDRRFKDANIIVHGHDALYIECYEKNAEAVRDLVDQMFGHTLIEGPAGNVELTAKANIGTNLANALGD